MGVATKPSQKPSGRLAKLTADIGKKEEIGLLTELRGYLLRKSKEEISDRRQDVIHPSEMAKKEWCPRQTYYRIAKTPIDPGTDPTRLYSFQMANVFAEGHHIHAKYQGWLADMGKLWGNWKCSYCGGEMWKKLAPTECDNCHYSGYLSYKEVPLHSDKYLISGHADGAVPGGMIEIKSIGLGTMRFEDQDALDRAKVLTADGREIYDIDKLWSNIKRPLPSHLRQGNIYLRLAAEMGYDLPKMTFIYEFKANQQVKEFTVKHNTAVTNPLFDKALDVVYALKVERPPDRPTFADSPDSFVCSACPFRRTCWGLRETTTESNSIAPAFVEPIASV